MCGMYKIIIYSCECALIISHSNIVIILVRKQPILSKVALALKGTYKCNKLT